MFLQSTLRVIDIRGISFIDIISSFYSLEECQKTIHFPDLNLFDIGKRF